MPGGNLFAKGRWSLGPGSYRGNAPYQLPMICVAGTLDGGDRYPLTEPEQVEVVLQQLPQNLPAPLIQEVFVRGQP